MHDDTAAQEGDDSSSRASVWLPIAVLVSGCAVASEQTAQQARARECPVTDVEGDSDYGNEYLHAILAWPDMTLVYERDDPGNRLADGSRTMKLAWYRLVHGELTIEGRRLDGDATPLRSWVPEGYSPDIGSISTELIFPTAGCWEVTGKVSGHSMTFVVRVVIKN